MAARRRGAVPPAASSPTHPTRPITVPIAARAPGSCCGWTRSRRLSPATVPLLVQPAPDVGAVLVLAHEKGIDVGVAEQLFHALLCQIAIEQAWVLVEVD